MKIYTRLIAVFLLTIISTDGILAQDQDQSTFISGIVRDGSTNETIVGAIINVKDYVVGTITDVEGRFMLDTDIPRPFTLEISSIGHNSKEVRVSLDTMYVSVFLQSDAIYTKEVVISASRVEEDILQAPVSIQKMSLVEIKESSDANYFNSIANLEGVHLIPNNLGIQYLNTRGFATDFNTRFVSYLDGVFLNLPGINYSEGNAVGASELDVRSIEVIPGAGSALYGPNVFNGAISIQSKNPFDYRGLSAFVKLGQTVQDVAGEKPFYNWGIRYAKVFNEKWAFKINLSHLHGYDWVADDRSYLISAQNVAFSDSLLALPQDFPRFDAVNLYGDETDVLVDVGAGAFVPVRRTGISEADLYDNEVDNIKAGLAIHHRINEKMEAVYHGEWARVEGMLRTADNTVAPGAFRHFHKLELNSNKFFFRTYFSQEYGEESYSLLSTASAIQEILKPSQSWASDYGAAFRGEVQGVPAGDHNAARAFADYDMPEPGSSAFEEARQDVISRGGFLTDNFPQRIDRSFFIHGEGQYNFELLSSLQVQVGGNYRYYSLSSNGATFNDGPNGFNGPIPIYEYGLYTQLGKSFFNDRLTLKGSIRFDDHKNFNTRWTPRISAVLGLDKAGNSFLRASYQTAFRNPSPLQSYTAFGGSSIILGGVPENLEAFTYRQPDGRVLTGDDITQSLISIASFQTFLAGGGTDPGLLRIDSIGSLRQELLTTYELGFRSILGKHLYTDIYAFYNSYSDFTYTKTAFSLLIGSPVSVFTSAPDEITSLGLGVRLNYVMQNGFRIGANYSYMDYDEGNIRENNPGFLANFNTPNQRFSISIGKKNLFHYIGFNMNYRWQESYVWETLAGIGEVDPASLLDASISFRAPAIRSVIKIGGTNILNNEYRQLYGGPAIGAQYYISLNFDEFF